MNEEKISVLLIEDNPGDARLIREFLRSGSPTPFETSLATTLAQGIKGVESNAFDAVLLDLGLPDSQGIATLKSLLEVKNTVPVIVSTGLNDMAVGQESLQQGAQDYLIKGQFNELFLMRTILYAIERKNAENQRKLMIRILAILNRQNKWQQLLKDILIEIKQFTGVESTGLRIREGYDFPYFEVNGFPDDFVRKENSLCDLDQDGKPVPDDQGKPVLECMCGDVIRRRFDPGKPFFTPKGSFWTNSLSDLPDGPPETERPLLPRNRCRREGYESLALVPLHSGDEVIGLLQLSDRRRDRFSISLIRFFEEIGETLGIAFRRMDAEQKVHERIKELNVLHNLSIISDISDTVAEYIAGVLDLVPTGFTSPASIYCRLVIEGREHWSDTVADPEPLFRSDILSYGRKVGVLEIGRQASSQGLPAPGLLSEEHELLITIAKSIGDHVGKVRSEQVRRVIHQIATFTDASGRLEELVGFIKDQLSQLIDTTNFYIALIDRETDMITIPYFADQKDTITTFPAGKSLTAYVIRKSTPLLATRTELDRLAETGEIETIGEKAAVWLGVPLKTGDEVIGVFAVQSYADDKAFTQHDLEMMEVISHQISLSIERKRREEELQQALRKAQESDRLKSAFLATMSHELRTPLNAVIGFSQLIEPGISQDEIQEFAGHILKGGRQLLSIIEDILYISVIESGLMELNMGSHPVDELLSEVDRRIRDEQEKLQKKHLQIRRIPESGHPGLVVHTDGDKVQQILMNLLKNALKFTREGIIEFGYRIGQDAGEQRILFFVKDTGIGIPAHLQEVIFDLFRQADETHTRTYGGTGLGLSVARKLAGLIGGTVTVESEEGRGASFFLSLPLIEIQPELRDIPPAGDREKEPVKGRSVLIAEDEESNFELLEILLGSFDLKVIWAKNGREAVDICVRHKEIGLVLMDLKMPVMTGFEATREIRKMHPDMPVIAQTAYAMPADREEALSAGCNEILTKPIKREELFRVVKDYLTV